MNVGIYYFTRTGNCKRIAEKIASKLSLDAHAINDNIDWTSWKAYFKFQSYAKGKKEIQIDYEGDIHSLDRLIIVSPVWGSKMPPAVKKFTEQKPKSEIDIIVSSKLSKMKNVEDFHHVVHIKQNEKKEDLIIDEYVDFLMDKTN